jgi:hypothetical protein
LSLKQVEDAIAFSKRSRVAAWRFTLMKTFLPN